MDSRSSTAPVPCSSASRAHIRAAFSRMVGVCVSIDAREKNGFIAPRRFRCTVSSTVMPAEVGTLKPRVHQRHLSSLLRYKSSKKSGSLIWISCGFVRIIGPISDHQLSSAQFCMMVGLEVDRIARASFGFARCIGGL
jgi:hypothetical protein